METKYLRLGSVCSKIGSGATPTGGKEAYQGGGYKLIRSQNVVDLRFAYEGLAEINEKQATKLNNVKVEEKDVLLNITGDSVARCCLAPIGILPARVNQHVAIIRPKAEILNPYYLLFWLIVNKQYLLALAAAGATRNGLTKAMISGLVIECPSLEKQNRIASILSTYDTLIENNAKRIRLLEKMAENLYKEWFVRFRFPGHENVEMENGLPKGWKMTNLFDVADVTYGFAFKSNKFCDNAELNPVVRIRDIQENHTNTYTDEQCEDKYLIGKNAILIGMDGIFHMCLWNGERAYMNQRVVMLNSKEKGVCNYLLYLAIRPQIKYWEQVISGTTVAHLGDKHLRKVKVLLPEKAILEKANSIISRAMDEKNILQHQNSLLARQRDLLLPRLMSGKLEVKEELLE